MFLVVLYTLPPGVALQISAAGLISTLLVFIFIFCCYYEDDCVTQLLVARVFGTTFLNIVAGTVRSVAAVKKT